MSEKQFVVDEQVFDHLPDYCVGLVVAKGIANGTKKQRIETLLDENVRAFQQQHAEDNVREIASVQAFREAFKQLNMNPNKFMCSIEALAKRAQKAGELPHINPIVDVGNALSVKYVLPMGAHDIDRLEDDLAVRFAGADDSFLPLGETAQEAVPEGELVYVSDHTVKTRRWIWRQSDDGKITEESCNVVFPIDGFEAVCGQNVLSARDELAKLLKEEFDCEVSVGYLNREQNRFIL